MFKMIVGVLFPLLAIAPIVSAQGSCNADNCLRAVRNTAPAFSQRGTADCKMFLQATSTPPTLTFTATSYLTITPDATTGIVTNTATVTPDIITSVISVTDISTPAPTTAVITETSVITSTVTIGGEPAILTKRQEATFPPIRVPAYASACSGILKYVNACSCIGVPRSTIIAEAPSTTTTATVLVTAVPSTVLVTQPATTTLSTVITVVTSLVTVTLDPSTTTVSSTQTDFTTLTSTILPSSTTAPACPSPTFYIQIADGKAASLYGFVDGFFPAPDTVITTSNLNVAAKFTIDSDNQLRAIFDSFFFHLPVESVVTYQTSSVKKYWEVVGAPKGIIPPEIPNSRPVKVQLGTGGSSCYASSGKLAGLGGDTQVFGYCNGRLTMVQPGEPSDCSDSYNPTLNYILVPGSILPTLQPSTTTLSTTQATTADETSTTSISSTQTEITTFTSTTISSTETDISTLTSTTISSTQTDVSTTTSLDVPTSTAAPTCATVPTTCASPSFYIQVTEGQGAGWFLTTQANTLAGSEPVRAVNTKNRAVPFSIDSAGRLVATYTSYGRQVTRVVYYRKDVNTQAWIVFNLPGTSEPNVSTLYEPVYVQLGNGGPVCPGSSGSGSSGRITHVGCDTSIWQGFGWCNGVIYSVRKGQDMSFCTGPNTIGQMPGLNFVVV